MGIGRLGVQLQPTPEGVDQLAMPHAPEQWWVNPGYLTLQFFPFAARSF